MPVPDRHEDLTALLSAWREGDRDAADRVLSQVYGDLRRLAAHYIRDERVDHTLNPTSLVHELYLRMLSGATPDWKDRVHFFAIAARQLRRLLVDHARRVNAVRRGGGLTVRVPIGENDSRAEPARDESLLTIDQLLTRLAEHDARTARGVELRFFGGLEETEIAEALQISVSTVRRDWAFARAWMMARLTGAVDPNT